MKSNRKQRLSARKGEQSIEDFGLEKTERGLRIGCGALVGVLLAISSSIYWLRNGGWWGFVLLLVVTVSLCVGLALRYGDEFF
ncbi:hypothetical protein [Ottowia sp. VDI28]